MDSYDPSTMISGTTDGFLKLMRNVDIAQHTEVMIDFVVPAPLFLLHANDDDETDDLAF